MTMADFSLSEGNDTFTITERVKATAHERVTRVLCDIYKHSQVEHTVLEDAKWRLHACERVEAWLETDRDYWMAVTHAVQDVLQAFPLKGYALNQVGFANG